MKRYFIKQFFFPTCVAIFIGLFGLIPHLASAASSIPVGANPFSSTLVGINLYVNNSGGNTVSVIDTTSNTITTSIAVGNGPDSSVLVGSRYLYVNDWRDNAVSIIDTTTNTVVGFPIAVGQGPWSSTLVGTNLYVNNRNANTISIIDVNPNDTGTYNTVTSTITLGSSPYSSTLVGGRYLYISNSNDNTISVLDTTTNTIVGSPIAVGNSPWSSILVGTDLYVNNSRDGTLSIIDTTTNMVVGSPFYLGRIGTWSSTLVGTDLYVNDNNDGTISVFDTTDNTDIATISTSGIPVSSTLVGGRYLYVNEIGSGGSFVSVFDTTTNTLVPVPPPTLTTAVADYTVLTLTYDEGLNTSSVPVPNDFVVDDNSDSVIVSSVQITGSTVVLTLASAVASSDTVTINYTPGAHPIEDMVLNEALSLSNQSVIVDNTTVQLTYEAHDNGTLSGNTSQTINYGSNGTPVTAVPDSGYEFVNWTDGSTENPRIDTNVTASRMFIANFAVAPYTLSYTAGTGGSITGTTSQVVDPGSDGTAVTAVPSPGYRFASWSDGSTENPRTDTDVTLNISVTANFTSILSGGGISGGGCALPSVWVWNGKSGTCQISTTVPMTTPSTGTPTTSELLGGGVCPASLTITDGMRAGDKNGVYDSYNKKTITQVNILQKQINRILAASYKEAAGPIDGIFGSLTKQGVERLQTALNSILKPNPPLVIDGIVGPFTRNAMNDSCGGM